VGNKIKQSDVCSKNHRKFWIGKFGYFWVDGKNTLYCYCPKCPRRFQMRVDEKDFTQGSAFYKSVKIDYNSV
jgi:hypothetical protein